MNGLPKDAFANLPAFPSYTMKESAVIPPIREQLHMGDGSSPDLTPPGVEVWFYFQHYRTGEMIIDGEPATIENGEKAIVSFDLKPEHLNFEGPHAGAFVVIYQDGSVEYPSETYIRVDVTPALASGDALNPDPEDPIQERGPPGPVGPQGPPGDTILSGPTDPDPTTGQLGDFYINTDTHTIFGPKTSSGWGSGVSLVGPPGPQGPQGPPGDTILSGTSNPTATVGQNGDFYINTDTWTIFGPKTSSGWGSGTSLIGPSGPQGPEGPRGPSVAIADNGTTAIDTATLLNFTDNIEVQPKGDGSGEAEIRATGSGGGSGGGSVSVEDDGSVVVDTADTLNFGKNVTVSEPSAGEAEVDAKDTHSVFESEDGSVSVEADTVILGDNITVTDEGSGKVRIDGSGSSGGGGSGSANLTKVDSLAWEFEGSHPAFKWFTATTGEDRSLFPRVEPDKGAAYGGARFSVAGRYKESGWGYARPNSVVYDDGTGKWIVYLEYSVAQKYPVELQLWELG